MLAFEPPPFTSVVGAAKGAPARLRASQGFSVESTGATPRSARLGSSLRIADCGDGTQQEARPLPCIPTPPTSWNGKPVFPWEAAPLSPPTTNSVQRDWAGLPEHLLESILLVLKESKGPHRKVAISVCGVCRSWRKAGQALFFNQHWKQPSVITHPAQLFMLSPRPPENGLLRCFVRRIDSPALRGMPGLSSTGRLRAYIMYAGADPKARNAHFLMAALQVGRRRFMFTLNQKLVRGIAQAVAHEVDGSGLPWSADDVIATLGSDVTCTNYELLAGRCKWARQLVAQAGYQVGAGGTGAMEPAPGALMRLGYRLRVRGLMLPRRIRVDLPLPQAMTQNPLFGTTGAVGDASGSGTAPAGPLGAPAAAAAAVAGAPNLLEPPPVLAAAAAVGAAPADAAAADLLDLRQFLRMGAAPGSSAAAGHGGAEADRERFGGGAGEAPVLVHPHEPQQQHQQVQAQLARLGSGRHATPVWLRRSITWAAAAAGRMAGMGAGASAGTSFVELQNKPPHWNEALKCWCLNFRGRVKMASVKNFQLVAAADAGSRCVMQFGKVEPDAYILDFNPSVLTSLQAFGCALSSFETKVLL